MQSPNKLIMKTLYLVRHAKSSWDDMSLQDYERPLLDKGKKRTQKVAEFLELKGVKPDLIVSSQAVRAYETAKILARKLNYPKEDIRIDTQLYFSGQQAMENVIFGVDDTVNEVMLVGHNPDMTNFANNFLEDKVDYLPTSAVVCLKFDTKKWDQVFLCKREVVFVIAPKTL